MAALAPGVGTSDEGSHPGVVAALVVIAQSLAGVAASWPGMSEPVCRQWDRMLCSTAVEAWVIAWPPGGAIELHDHGGSSGAVVVVAGELTETSVVVRGDGRPVLRTATLYVAAPPSGSRAVTSTTS